MLHACHAQLHTGDAAMVFTEREVTQIEPIDCKNTVKARQLTVFSTLFSTVGMDSDRCCEVGDSSLG